MPLPEKEPSLVKPMRTNTLWGLPAFRRLQESYSNKLGTLRSSWTIKGILPHAGRDCGYKLCDQEKQWEPQWGIVRCDRQKDRQTPPPSLRTNSSQPSSSLLSPFLPFPWLSDILVSHMLPQFCTGDTNFLDIKWMRHPPVQRDPPSSLPIPHSDKAIVASAALALTRTAPRNILYLSLICYPHIDGWTRASVPPR